MGKSTEVQVIVVVDSQGGYYAKGLDDDGGGHMDPDRIYQEMGAETLHTTHIVRFRLPVLEPLDLEVKRGQG